MALVKSHYERVGRIAPFGKAQWHMFPNNPEIKNFLLFYEKLLKKYKRFSETNNKQTTSILPRIITPIAY